MWQQRQTPDDEKLFLFQRYSICDGCDVDGDGDGDGDGGWDGGGAGRVSSSYLGQNHKVHQNQYLNQTNFPNTRPWLAGSKILVTSPRNLRILW